MEIYDDTLDYLEAHIPELAAAALTHAYWQALASGSSVLSREKEYLVEVFPDGHRQLIKKLPPVTYVPVGSIFQIP
jgi:hypothetical protein